MRDEGCLVTTLSGSSRPSAFGHPNLPGTGREPQLGARIGLGPGEAIDELVVGELLEPLQGEGRAQ